MTSKDSDIFKVPKLLADGSNWITYKDRLRWALDARGLSDHLDDNTSEPQPSTVATESSTTTTDSERRGYVIRLEKWRVAEATIKQCIASTVPDSIFNRVKSKKTAKEVWDAVGEIFEGRSLMVAIDLQQKMQNLRCGENHNARTHFDTLCDMNERLSSMGVTLADHEFGSILIGSLPPIYDPTISSILASARLSKTTLDPTTVINLITDDYDRRIVTRKKGRKDDKDVAFSAEGASQSGKSGGRKDVKCHNCGKKGHFKADCWAKGGGKEGQGPKKRDDKKGGSGGTSAGAATTDSDKEDGVWAVVSEDEMFEDWTSDSSEETDWSLLSEANSEGEDPNDSPTQHIPDADPEDAAQLRHILLSRNANQTSLRDECDDSIPDLQSVSDTDSDTDSVPTLRSVSETDSDDDNEHFMSTPQAHSCTCSEQNHNFIGCDRPVDSNYSGSESDLDSEEPSYGDTYLGPPDTSFVGAVLAGSAESRKAESDLYDSGASRHMTPFRHRLINFMTIDSRPIRAADKRIFHAVSKGDMQIQIPNGRNTTTILLKDVLYAPDMGLTIISISRVAAAGYSTLFHANFCRIFDHRNSRIGHIHVTSNGLYRVDHEESTLAAETKGKISLLELHRKMGHIAPDAVRKLVKEGRVEGIELEDEREIGTCESCEYAKTTRKKVRREREEPRASHFGDEIHSDVWGPSPIETINHRRYYTSFTDDHTRYTHIALLTTKDETFDAYKHFEAWAGTQHGVKLKRLRSDRGGEYLSTEFRDHLRSRGTERRLTTHDTPQHNGIAESLNRRLLERTRAILHQSGLPKFLWGEAVMHAVWLKNRTSTRILENMTPFEALTGRKPDLSELPEWGAKVWVHDDEGNKLEGRSKIGRWVGFDEESTHAHRIYWPDRRTVSVERNIKFDENFILIPKVDMPLEGEIEERLEKERVEDKSVERDQLPDVNQPVDTQPFVVSPITPEQLPRRSSRARKPASYLKQLNSGEGSSQGTYKNGRHIGPKIPVGMVKNMEAGAVGEDEEDLEIGGVEFVMGAATMEAEGLDPRTLEEAKARSDWPMWKEAMEKELEALRKASTWTVVERPPGKNIVGCKWVFRIKKNALGQIEKYKARLVARGFTQVYGVDYTETFAPVAKLSSLRTILAIAARNDWPIEVFDFNSAFLNGQLDEEIFMQLPPGFEDTNSSTLVAHLNKAIYGLKQAGRTWYTALHSALDGIGFKRSNYDHGVFYAQISAGLVVLAIHVDDCTITGNTQALLDTFKVKINARYTMTDLGPISWLLGIGVTRNRKNRTITLSQQSYIESILARFNLTDAKPLSIPMDPNISFSKDDCPTTPDEVARMRRVPYREAIGSLMYASVGTRPDISFAVSTLSQFLDNPGQAHWEAVKRVFCYLLGTKDWGLTYGGGKEGLEGFTDADGASQEHRRAISGHAFLIDGGAVSWSSRKQELVKLSTAEAEYVAATHAAKEGIWLRNFIGEVFTPFTDPTILHCDNQSAVAIATNGNFHARTKHIDIRYHFIRFVIENGSLTLVYCPTDDMTADILTKALPSSKAKHFAASLGLSRIPT